jgi:hypothetical protein
VQRLNLEKFIRARIHRFPTILHILVPLTQNHATESYFAVSDRFPAIFTENFVLRNFKSVRL